MRARWAVLALPLLLLGATQINSDLDITPFFCEFSVHEAAAGIAPGTDNGSCYTPGVTPGLLNTVAGGANWYVPANQRLVLREFGVVLNTSALVATEDCNLVLQADTTTAGAGSTISTLTTGPGGTMEAECSPALVSVLDAIGESCTINNFSTVIPGGGFWRVRWDDNDGGGANTCTAWDGGTVWVRGFLSPQ